MIPLTFIATLVLTGLLYILFQHGWGNTLISLGTRIAASGMRFNARTEARRRVVVAEWMARLEEAGQQ